MAYDFEESLIIELERDYPLVNVRPIAFRVGNDPQVHHPEGALRFSVKKAQEKAEAENVKNREVAERRVTMERRADAFSATYARFLDWFNSRLWECHKVQMTGPELVDFFTVEIELYERDNGREMAPYFRRIMEYHLARWRREPQPLPQSDSGSSLSPVPSNGTEVHNG